MVFPLKNLSDEPGKTREERAFTYSMQDIDRLSAELGIPWQLEKDIPFSATFTYTGLDWDLVNMTVSLPKKKQEKYINTIVEWNKMRVHTLNEVQQLYGRLLHTTRVVPVGHAYLPNLEAAVVNGS